MTVTSIQTDIQVQGRENWEELVTNEQRLIPPDNYYPAFIPLTLTGNEVDSWILDTLMASIVIKVFYVDAMDKPGDQTFTNLAHCGINGLRSHEYLGAGPDEKKNQTKKADHETCIKSQ